LQVTQQEAAAVRSLDSRRLKNVMLDNSAYPEQFPDRGNPEFEIPFGMFAKGNRIEKFGLKHTETDASRKPLRIIITERKTTPRQVTNTYNMYREGFNPRKGTSVVVVDAFGNQSRSPSSNMRRWIQSTGKTSGSGRRLQIGGPGCEEKVRVAEGQCDGEMDIPRGRQLKVSSRLLVS
jgi:hypothetical protein